MAALPRPTIAGLCATCAHVRRIATERGSTFYQCRMAWKDDRFAKYPILPVLHCVGYTTTAAEASPPPQGST